MDSKDIFNLGLKAKRETEDFINSYLNDGSKGWPKICLCNPSKTKPRQEQWFRKRSGVLATTN